MKLLNRIFFIFCIFSVFYPLHLSLLTDGEVDAITAFYSNLGLDVSTLASDPCSWIGIGCAYNPSTTYDNVINITLSNYNLPGQLTNQILPNLQLLDLSQNQLRNRLLITSYSQLRILKLNNNRFTGFASSTINFQYLIYFDVSKNVITGPLPNIASNLPSLRTFNLSGNVFTGSIPDWNSMSSLSILDLSHNFISGTIPNWQNLPLLTRLQLNNNGLSGKVPDFMQLSHLVYLDVSRNQLTGMVAMPFSNLPNLQYFDFSFNSFATLSPTFQPSRIPTIAPTLSPTLQPTLAPTRQPTMLPSSLPSSQPSAFPTRQPTGQPSGKPTSQPSRQPSSHPSSKPSTQPSSQPTIQPSSQPTSYPTSQPSGQPTSQPTKRPTSQPSSRPSSQPTKQPTSQPTTKPSTIPSSQPTKEPSYLPSSQPSSQPTSLPTGQPTTQPTSPPISRPTSQPSIQPTSYPSSQPTALPSNQPTSDPTRRPTTGPTTQPTSQPSSHPSSLPTTRPTTKLSRLPSSQPTRQPSSNPSARPSNHPSCQPTTAPSSQPSSQPTIRPSTLPTSKPSSQPTNQPSCRPTSLPSSQPTHQPTVIPSTKPSSKPSTLPSKQPSSSPSSSPSSQPTAQPSSQPTIKPSLEPSSHPSSRPSTQPTVQATSQPTSLPTIGPAALPTSEPTLRPNSQPSSRPTTPPSSQPTLVTDPSPLPSAVPTIGTSNQPSSQPTFLPTATPTDPPSSQPSSTPTTQPSSQLSILPTTTPSSKPSSKPSMRPITVPSSVPLLRPSVQPSSLPTSNPTNVPSAEPTYTPSSQPTNQPSSQPTLNPSSQPTARPSQQPISRPTSKPSSQSTQIPTVHKGGVKPAHSSYSTSSVYGRVKGSIFLLGINLPLLYTSFILNISDFLSTPSTTSLLGNSYVIFGSSSQRSSFSLNQPSSFTEAYYTEIIVEGGGSGVSVGGMMRDAPTRSFTIVGDVNKDGLSDVLIGYPLSDVCEVITATTSEVISTIIMNGVIPSRSSSKSQLGWATAALGDINHDGVPDFMLSAPLLNEVYVIYGSSSLPRNLALAQLSTEQGCRIIGSARDRQTGIALSYVGDVNGDGYGDIAMSAIRDTATIVYVMLGGENSWRSNDGSAAGVIRIDDISSSSCWRIIGERGMFAGLSLAGVGDVNDDGYDDVVIGSVPYDVTGGSNSVEQTYVIYGKGLRSGEELRLQDMRDGEDGYVITGGGFVVGGIGDVNEDGIADIMVVRYESWQQQSNAYVMILPKYVTSPSPAPTSAAPSLFPSYNPTSQPTSQPSSSQPSSSPTIERTSEAPLSPNQSRRPTIQPSRRPTIVKTNIPATTPIPWRRPSVHPTSSKPTTSPSFRQVLPTQTPTRNPSRRLTPVPSRQPSITTSTTRPPSPSPSSTRHSFDSADVIKVNGSGRFYGQMDNATSFIVDVNEMSAVMDDESAASSLVIVNLVGRRGRKLYTISPLSSSSYDKAVGRARERGVDVVKVVIEDFHNESDVIDLRRFGNGLYSIYSLEGVSYSVPPVVLLLSEWPVRMTVELRSVSSMSSLSGQNFLFSSGSSEGSSEGGCTLIIAVCVSGVVGFLMLSISFWYWKFGKMKNSKEKKKSNNKKNKRAKQVNEIVKVQPDSVLLGNEIRAPAIVNLDENMEEKSETVIPALPKLVPLAGLDDLFDEDSMDFSLFPSLSELSYADDDNDEALLEEEDDVLDDDWFE